MMYEIIQYEIIQNESKYIRSTTKIYSSREK